MWLKLQKKDGNFVDEIIYLNRVTIYLDCMTLNGVSVAIGRRVLRAKAFYLYSKIIGNKHRTRWSDVKRHLQKMVAKNLIFSDRLAMFFEAWDLLLGQEDFWVPSHRNALAIFQDIDSLLAKNPETIIRVE